MKHPFPAHLLCALAFPGFMPLTPAGALPPLPEERVLQIGEWLREDRRDAAADQPGRVFFTPSFADRTFWDSWRECLDTGELMAAAADVQNSPPPEITRDLFQLFYTTGQRPPFERPYSQRTERLGILVYAEGFSDKGRFLSAIERELRAILEEPTWAVPAHLPEGASPQEARQRIELGSAARSWSLATVYYLLGDRLEPETRGRIRSEVRERILDPYFERIRAGDRRGFYWMDGRHNWTAICHAGVLGSTILVSDSLSEWAEAIAAFELLTQPYVDSFGSDGFCEEGIPYWSYGFRHYTLGAELIRLLTRDRIDLLSGEQQRRIALFPRRWQVVPGVYPAFGDASVNSVADTMLQDFFTIRHGTAGGLLGTHPQGTMVRLHPLGAQLYVMPFALTIPRPEPGTPEADAFEIMPTPIRDWFPEGGALVVRSGTPGRGLSAAFKGGHNGQAHNHNYLGSFVLVNGNDIVLTDLGRDVYVRATFGPHRYTSGVMNSFGHPVPRVAGRLQEAGRSARAETVRVEFSDVRDVWEMDLTSAYKVPELQRLTRTFSFQRPGVSAPGGKLEIVDTVRFEPDKSPQAFGSALVLTLGHKVESIADGVFRVIAADGASVEVYWEVTGDAGASPMIEEPIYGIVPETGPRGRRLGFETSKPVHEASIRFTFIPTLE